jgi:hypothetical protein
LVAERVLKETFEGYAKVLKQEVETPHVHDPSYPGDIIESCG